MGWTAPRFPVRERVDEDAFDRVPVTKDEVGAFKLAWLLIAIGVLVLLGVAWEWSHAATLMQKYPRVGMYLAQSSGGSPYIKGTGALDSLFIRRTSRYPVVSFGVDPAGNVRPDLPGLVRYYNPDAVIVFYTLVGFHWVAPSSMGGGYPPTNTQYNAQMWRVIDSTNGWLWGTDGNVWFENYNVNLANRATADSLGVLLKGVALTHINDGWWLDDFHASGMTWTDGSLGRRLDFARAGFATRAQFDSAYFVNCQRIVDAIRSVTPTAVIFCNGCDGLARVDGTMREGIGAGGGLPDEAAAMWFADTSSYANPWLKDENYNTYGTPANYLNGRRNLALANMGHGWSFYGNNGALSPPPHQSQWWLDEYAVRPYPYTYTDTTGKFVGWLGTPGDTVVYKWALETDYRGNTRMVPTVMLRWFENGVVLFNRTTTPYTFKLYATFKRIQGVLDPFNNNGQENQTFTVTNDALFLVRKPRPKPERP